MGVPVVQIDTKAAEANMGLSEALQILGPPLHISATGNGYSMAWEYWQIGENSIGISLGVLGADFLNLDWGRMHTSGEYLLLSFDAAHRVTSATRSTWDGQAGSGMAVQPLASVISVVDSDDLRDSLPQHRWGEHLLQTLPRGLNRDSNSNEGQNGLQRRGTSGAIGQHSLDFTR